MKKFWPEPNFQLPLRGSDQSQDNEQDEDSAKLKAAKF